MTDIALSYVKYQCHIKTIDIIKTLLITEAKSELGMGHYILLLGRSQNRKWVFSQN